MDRQVLSGFRRLRVGGERRVDADVDREEVLPQSLREAFPAEHLHRAQQVGRVCRGRKSGSTFTLFSSRGKFLLKLTNLI